MDPTEVLRRHDALKSRRGNWDSLWSEVARRVWPQADEFRSTHAPGQPRNNRQYDSFAQLALSRFAAAIASGLTPRSATWHLLTTGYPEIDERPEVQAYLEGLNRLLWRARYMPRANWDGQAHEAYLSLGAFGTGVMFCDEHPAGGTRYRSVHLSQVYLCQDASGMVDTVHREFEMTARQLAQQFAGRLPEKVAKALERGRLDDTFTVLHCVMPREDYEPGRLDAKGRPFSDLYILTDEKHVLSDGGFYEFPYAVARYITTPRETYGRGPGTMLLPDIKMVNEMKRVVIEAANMAVDPPTLLRDDGILGEFRLTPGARNYGGVDENGRPAAVPFNNGAQPGIGLELIQEVKGQIDDGFLGVYFRVLLENPNMTATQAMLIAQQQGQMTSPVLGRLQAELLGPLIRRESGILYRQGRHPEMPEALAEFMRAEGEALLIEYDSPMSRQARSEEGVAILRTFEALAPMAQIDPSVYAQFDPREVARLMAEVNGVPRSVLRSDEEIAAMQEQQAQQQGLAAALQAAPVAAQTIESLTRAQREAGSSPQVVQ